MRTQHVVWNSKIKRLSFRLQATAFVSEIFFRLFSNCCHFFFFGFYFVYALQSNDSNTDCVLGHQYIWALLRANFNPRLTVRAKMSVSRAHNAFFFYAREHKLCCFNNILQKFQSMKNGNRVSPHPAVVQ